MSDGHEMRAVKFSQCKMQLSLLRLFSYLAYRSYFCCHSDFLVSFEQPFY